MTHSRRAAQDKRNVPGFSRGAGTPGPNRVRMLGGFSVSVGNRSIEEGEWRLRKAASLIKLLALAPRHRLHRERVMDLLWPEMSEKAAANNLRRVLHDARRTFEPAPATASSRYLRLRGDFIDLNPEGLVWVDVEAYEDTATIARRSRDLAFYRTALDLYAGDLLLGDLYEPWAEDRREKLRGDYLTLLSELARLHEECGKYALAIDALKRVLSEEPDREEAHAHLIRLYALSGQAGEALRQYERLEEILRRELGEDPEHDNRLWCLSVPSTSAVL